ncbi:MAG: hypothetical protein Q8S00_29350 [Deltaproteobacteria bacterium]|nr:hypothetical protein [Deltaproteobacteria bacterium]
MDAVDVSKLSDEERLALAGQLASNIRASLPKQLYAGSFTLKSKLPYKATSFRGVLIHRVSDIADVAIELYQTDRLVPAFIATRAVVETTATVYWLYQRSREFLDKPDEASFDEFLMRGMLGSKDSTTKMESYNVLTAVDRLDKEFEGMRQMYDTLCEFTHPNWSGVMGSYSKIDKQKYTLYLGKEHTKPPLAFGLGPLIGSLVIFQDYYNALANVLKAMNDRYE